MSTRHVQFGNLAITAPQPSGNTAVVSIDQSNPTPWTSRSTANPQEFSRSQVFNITYKGGIDGGDTFTNHTNLVELAYVYGTGNTVTGGTSFNYVFYQWRQHHTPHVQRVLRPGW